MTDDVPEESRRVPVEPNGDSPAKITSLSADPALTSVDSLPVVSQGSSAVWLASCFAAAAILGLLAAHAPLRIRLIGLFPIAVGVFAGVVFSHISVRQQRKARSAAIVGCILSLLMLIGATLESHRTFANQVRAATNEAADKVLLSTMQKGDLKPGADASTKAAELLQDAARERDASAASIPAYLQHRLSGIGKFEQPWPIVVWIVETLLGAAACGIMIRQCLSSHTRHEHALKESAAQVSSSHNAL